MATTNPTIIANNDNGLTITGVNGFTYDQFLNSLGSNVFRVLSMFLTASSMAQLNQLINYSISDSNGTQYDEVINFEPDPYQTISSFSKDLSDRNIILNGQSSLDFTILPGESLMIQLRSEEYSVSNGLDKLSRPNKYMLDGLDESVYAGGIVAVGKGQQVGKQNKRMPVLTNNEKVLLTAVAAVAASFILLNAVKLK